jgi:PPP family 3-phenylpropionic acid transporter
MALDLHRLGLAGPAIGAVLAAPLLARLLTAPLIAHAADRLRLRRTAVVALALASAAAFLALGLVRAPGLVGLFWFVGATLLTACAPLVDVLVLKGAAEEGFSYAAARAVGSLAYVGGNLAGGALVAALGAGVVVAWISCASVLTALAAVLVLPPTPVHAADASARGRGEGALGAWRLLSNAPFRLAILSGGLIQASHAYYYAFSTLLWRRQGLGAETSGALWAVGVMVEVAFLAFGDGIRRRLGPERLLLLGGLGAVIRWSAFALAPPPAALFPLQALHALSFAATFLAALELVQRHTAHKDASLAQSLNAALSAGVLIGLATLASGPLFDRAGPRGYLAMAALAALGLLPAIALIPPVPTPDPSGPRFERPPE